MLNKVVDQSLQMPLHNHMFINHAQRQRASMEMDLKKKSDLIDLSANNFALCHSKQSPTKKDNLFFKLDTVAGIDERRSKFEQDLKNQKDDELKAKIEAE